ncbi:hypothetical protein [Pseudomonas rhodesiae]|jgi:hypothetical protein|uniref:hypothetical protein n=1 Tax=Pseudomonas rhodesiae TaxID=76760 RepID=UPI0028D4BC6D|nr:hypothetical protein [Pseudomonas rhodesiae]
MNLSELSTKKIYLTKEFMSYSSSLLHLPIFTSLHSKEDTSKNYIFKTDRYWGFDDVVIHSPWLSIKSDFKVFSFILRNFYSNFNKENKNPYEFNFSIEKYLEDLEIRNNRSYYVSQIKASIEKLSLINIGFTKDDKRYVCKILSAPENECLYDKNQLTGDIKIKIDSHFVNFFNHNPELILNIDHKELDSVEGDFAKVLYTFYKTNQQTNIFDKEVIIQRLRPDADRKLYRKILTKIKEAHNELIECGLIEKVDYQKKWNVKEISHFKIDFTDGYTIQKYKKEAEIERRKKEESNKKLEEIKNKRPNLFEKKKDQEDEEPKDDPIPF